MFPPHGSAEPAQNARKNHDGTAINQQAKSAGAPSRFISAQAVARYVSIAKNGRRCRTIFTSNFIRSGNAAFATCSSRAPIERSICTVLKIGR